MKEKVAEHVAEHVEAQVHWTTQLVDYVWSYLVMHAMDFIGAILILVIGYWVARFFEKFSERLMERTRVDKSVMGFVAHLVYFLILVIVVIAALSKLGVPTNSFVAALGGLGVGIGLALKDNVSNFAAGIIILVFKPFRVGDFVVVGGSEGEVTSITMMTTHLKTLGNQDIVVPNNMMTSSIIKNYSVYPTRCIEMYLDVGYDTDLDKVLKLLRELFDADDDVLNPTTMPLGVREFGDNSIRIYARPEVYTDRYWAIYYRLMKNIKIMFQENDIDIPFPQRVLHLVHSLGEEPPRTLAEQMGFDANGDLTKGT